ncbi:MAG: hypothetical protein L0H41_04975 [Microlunatus sp.]|nr:hypothetical protein [Microlunatus sp.]
MKEQEVDERTTTWEIALPTFRVLFWKYEGELKSTQAFNVSNAFVGEVLEWAEDRSAKDGSGHSVGVLNSDGTGVGVVWLTEEPPHS